MYKRQGVELDSSTGFTSSPNYTGVGWNEGTSIPGLGSQYQDMANGCGSAGINSPGDDTKEFWMNRDNKYDWFIDSAHRAEGGGGRELDGRGLKAVNDNGLSSIDFSTTKNHNTLSKDQLDFKTKLTSIGTYFRFEADPTNTVYEIVNTSTLGDVRNYSTYGGSCSKCEESHQVCSRSRFRIFFRNINGDTINLDVWDPRSAVKPDGSTTTGIEIVDTYYDLSESVEMAQDNAIWETEPKEDVDLDLYYEATQALPIHLDQSNNESFIPRESSIKVHRPGAEVNPIFVANNPVVNTIVKDIVGIRDFDSVNPYPFAIHTGDVLKFTHENGMVTEATVIDHWYPITSYNNESTDEVSIYKPSLEFTIPCFIPTPTEGAEGGILTISTANLPDGFLDAATADDGTIWEMSSTVEDLIPNGTLTTGVSTIDTGAEINFETNGDDSTVIGTPPATYNITFKQITGYYRLDYRVYKSATTLPWFNCYSFGNGLESDRIRDDYNAPTIDNGCKVSTLLDTYGEERRSSGMIYSGIYNSTSGVNDLNEFNMSEKITKDLNPSYGSLQALKTRDTNVVAFCEDKVFKILANNCLLYTSPSPRD